MVLAYSKSELIVDGIIHVVGLAAGVAATISLMWVVAYQDDAVVYLACAIYGLGLLGMFGLSASYHLVQRQPLREVLRRLDHAAIFVMIAGTYTPFALVKLRDPWGTVLFGAVWAITLLGIVLKLRYPRRLERLSIALYLLQGWAILAAIEPLIDAISISGVALIGIGGLLYSLGVVFHLNPRLPFHNAIWHGLVLAGAGCHYAAVMDDVALAAVKL